jgi:CheY-like chemotaxis protein
MAKKKILVVDDESAFTRMLKRNLEATGRFEVREENTGTGALAVARQFLPDLVLLDVMMPEIAGGDVAAQFGQDALLKSVPIIFLTAIVGTEEVSPTGSFIGGHTFLAKPVKLDNLLTCIGKFLGK